MDKKRTRGAEKNRGVDRGVETPATPGTSLLVTIAVSAAFWLAFFVLGLIYLEREDAVEQERLNSEEARQLEEERAEIMRRQRYWEERDMETGYIPPRCRTTCWQKAAQLAVPGESWGDEQ